MWHIALVLLLGLGFVDLVSAQFQEFFWLQPNGNETTGCADGPNLCEPPSICARDGLTRVAYCCPPDSNEGNCWVGSPPCAGPAGGPSDTQIACGTEEERYCCLSNRDECLPREDVRVGQGFGLCQNTLDNVVTSLDLDRLRGAYSSAAAASPTSSTLYISADALLALTAVPTGATPSATAQTTSNTAGTSFNSFAAPSASGSSDASGSSGISGGTIGGIVGGVVGGLAVVIVAGFLVWRQRRKQPKAPAELETREIEPEKNNTVVEAPSNSVHPKPAELPGDPRR